MVPSAWRRVDERSNPDPAAAMISHAMLGTDDVPRAKAFYDEIMALLGAAPMAWTSPTRLFYGNGNGPFFAIGWPFDGTSAAVGNGTMIGFVASSRANVDAIHAKALALGSVDEGAPGIRGDNPDGYYNAYFRDPDGHKICLFCLGPEEKN